VVPKLKGKTLVAAKKLLTKANCRLGKVTKKKGPKSRKGKVVSQKPAPGAKKPLGTKIAVVIGK
jgi:beta-lactam-binding protein with PASTA domain